MKKYDDRSFMVEYPLSTLKPIKKTMQKHFLIALIFVGVYFYMGMYFFETNSFKSENLFNPYALIGAIIVFFIAVGLVYCYELWYYRTYFYNLTENLIIIRKGPIIRKEISMPYYRVQDVYFDQDILDRLFGLYDVHISTATASSEVRAHIDGLEKEQAEKLRELILGKMESGGQK